MNNLLNIKKNIIIALVVTLGLFTFCDVEAYDYDSDEGSSGEESNYSDPLPGVEYHNRSFGYLPEGESSEFNVYTKDGVSLKSYYTARKFIDFGDHVNSSGPSTVTVFDGEAGFDTNISLGCDGIDMGLEAIAEFDASDFLKYLPRYIKTKLATEALAQIYSLPLVSTVMDGLKSMQNFVAEFKQASCNMKDVTDRANELKNERYNACIQRATKPGQEINSAIEKQCSDPSGLEKSIKEFQEFAGQKISLGESMDKLFASGLHDAIGASDDPEDGVLGISPGRFVSMFIPDIRAGFNGNHQGVDVAKPQLPTPVTYEKAESVANNITRGVYDDLIISIEGKDIDSLTRIRDIIMIMQEYKDLVMKYGSVEVYTDRNAENHEQYSEGAISYIEGLYTKYHKYFYKDLRTDTGLGGFAIGPQKGVMKNGMSADDTDLTGMAKDLLTYGNPNKCFVKVDMSDGDSELYRWEKVHTSVDAIGSLIKMSGKLVSEEGGSDSDAIISRIAKCKTAHDLMLTTMHDYMTTDKSLAHSYYRKVSSDSAYKATSMLLTYTENMLRKAKDNSYAELKKSCEKKGVENLDDNSAVKRSGDSISNTNAYKDCDEYAEQNQLSDEKKDSIEGSIQTIRSDLKIVEDEVKKYQKDFDDRYDLYLAKLRNK